MSEPKSDKTIYDSLDKVDVLKLLECHEKEMNPQTIGRIFNCTADDIDKKLELIALKAKAYLKEESHSVDLLSYLQQ